MKLSWRSCFQPETRSLPLVDGGHQPRDLGRVVLQVGVHGDDHGAAAPRGSRPSRAAALPKLRREGHGRAPAGRRRASRLDRRERAVGAAVVDDPHLVDAPMPPHDLVDALDQFGQRLGLVEGRDDDREVADRSRASSAHGPPSCPRAQRDLARASPSSNGDRRAVADRPLDVRAVGEGVVDVAVGGRVPLDRRRASRPARLASRSRQPRERVGEGDRAAAADVEHVPHGPSQRRPAGWSAPRRAT